MRRGVGILWSMDSDDLFVYLLGKNPIFSFPRAWSLRRNSGGFYVDFGADAGHAASEKTAAAALLHAIITVRR